MVTTISSPGTTATKTITIPGSTVTKTIIVEFTVSGSPARTGTESLMSPTGTPGTTTIQTPAAALEIATPILIAIITVIVVVVIAVILAIRWTRAR